MTQWNINCQTTRRVTICVWLISAIAILLGCRIIFRNLKIEFDVKYALLVSTLMLIISVILFLNNKKRKLGKLVINEDFIVIPRFIFAEIRLSIKEITFVDVNGAKFDNSYIVMGRKLQDSLVISSAVFSSESDMRQFLKILSTITGSKLQNNACRKSSFEKIKEQKITISFLIFLIAVYCFCMYFFSLKFSEFLEYVSLKKSTVFSVDWYRYFSSAFFHIDFWHLLSNLLTLSLLGRAVEGIVSWQRYINIILISIFTGSIVSVYFSPYDHVVGASGGIMGLFGSYMVFYYKYGDNLIESKFPKRSTIFLFLIMQVVADTCVGSTDIATHLGGFFAGVAYAHIVSNNVSLKNFETPNKLELFFSIIIFTIFILGILKAITRIAKF